MEHVNNKKLLQYYIDTKHIMDYFSACKPNFLLFHYFPGELLTNPFSPSEYIQFVVDGDLILYDMPNEESTVSIQTSSAGVSLLGDVEIVDSQFVPFFVEAHTDVYTVAIYIEMYRDELLNDPAFLRHICRSLANKLNDAVNNSRALPLKMRIDTYINYSADKEYITDIGYLAKMMGVSTRQLIRVLKECCAEGALEHVGKGKYKILREGK